MGRFVRSPSSIRTQLRKRTRRARARERTTRSGSGRFGAWAGLRMSSGSLHHDSISIDRAKCLDELRGGHELGEPQFLFASLAEQDHRGEPDDTVLVLDAVDQRIVLLGRVDL